MKREIVLDTETTGLNPLGGDRIVEIGCVELINHIPSGRHFHRYVNPERAMPEVAFRVHGLSDEFLRDKPKYAEVAGEFSEFVASAVVGSSAISTLGSQDRAMAIITRWRMPERPQTRKPRCTGLS